MIKLCEEILAKSALALQSLKVKIASKCKTFTKEGVYSHILKRYEEIKHWCYEDANETKNPHNE